MAVIYIALCTFAFLIYAAPNSHLGSISLVYDNLTKMSAQRPVHGNKEGSFMTMWSMEGFVFGIINILGESTCRHRASCALALTCGAVTACKS